MITTKVFRACGVASVVFLSSLAYADGDIVSPYPGSGLRRFANFLVVLEKGFSGSSGFRVYTRDAREILSRAFPSSRYGTAPLYLVEIEKGCRLLSTKEIPAKGTRIQVSALHRLGDHTVLMGTAISLPPWAGSFGRRSLLLSAIRFPSSSQPMGVVLTP
jgi:hypothetical protein